MATDETPAGPDDCPWPVGTVLTSTGESATFRWIFEHHVNGAWYEMGSEQRFTWAEIATFPNLTEMVVRPAAVADQAGETLDLDAAAVATARPYLDAALAIEAARERAARLARLPGFRAIIDARNMTRVKLAEVTRERDEARGENARILVALSHRGLRWVPDEWRVEAVGDDGSGT